MTKVENEKPFGRASLSPTFWLVVRSGEHTMEVLVSWCGDEQALPVFSGEAEAEMFVWLGGVRSRKAGRGRRKRVSVPT